MRRKDLIPLAALAAAAAALHAPALFGNRLYFHDDLTHITFPWRVLSAELLQRGAFPHWNPYSYFGIPLWANMQTGILHPFGLLFHLFDYADALGWFLWLQQTVAAAFAYLWLRARRLSRPAATAGAAVLSLGGFAVAYLQFPNMIGVVLHAPMLLLFAGSAPLFAAAGALAFFAGYPPYWAFLIPACWILGRRFSWKGLAGAIALSAVLWIPGAQLVRVSARGEKGLAKAERTRQSLRPYQLLGILHPEAARRWDFHTQTPRPYREQVVWESPRGTKTFTFDARFVENMKDAGGIRYVPHRTFYIGIGAAALALLGFAAVKRREKALYAAFLLGSAVLVLGKHTRPSEALWSSFWPLHYLRGPARLSFLFTLAAMPLAAAGVETLKGRLRWAAAALIVVELTAYGAGFYPTIPKADYAEKGPLVEFLQKHPEERFFQAPSLEVWAHLHRRSADPDFAEFRAQVYKTYKQKLFGVSNAVYHLYDGNGAFEPLIPSKTRAVIEALKAAPVEERAALMKRYGIRRWLSRSREDAPGLRQEGLTLWHSAAGEPPKDYESPWKPGPGGFYAGLTLSLASFAALLSLAWRKRPRKGYTIA